MSVSMQSMKKMLALYDTTYFKKMFEDIADQAGRMLGYEVRVGAIDYTFYD